MKPAAPSQSDGRRRVSCSLFLKKAAASGDSQRPSGAALTYTVIAESADKVLDIENAPAVSMATVAS